MVIMVPTVSTVATYETHVSTYVLSAGLQTAV
jgi:hypothetical protein